MQMCCEPAALVPAAAPLEGQEITTKITFPATVRVHSSYITLTSIFRLPTNQCCPGEVGAFKELSMASLVLPFF